MKLKELFEFASSGVTSVASIGDVEFVDKPAYIKLYKRCDVENKHKCIATIKRKTGNGWRFKPTSDWNKMNLPHIGYLNSIKPPVSGSKTITNNLENMLKAWGVNYNSLIKREK